jgi:GNAT superfamily N-acetyltransferase
MSLWMTEMDVSTLTIRPASESDRSVLEDLIADCYATVYPGWYEEETLEEALPAMLRIDPALLGSGRYLLARAGNVIAGCGGWSANAPGKTPNDDLTGHIRHFATRPDAMGKGIGGAILERCIAEAAASGMARLKCFSSLAAEGFYSRHGFEKLDNVNVMLGSGAYFPAVLMERALG